MAVCNEGLQKDCPVHGTCAAIANMKPYPETRPETRLEWAVDRVATEHRNFILRNEDTLDADEEYAFAVAVVLRELLKQRTRPLTIVECHRRHLDNV